MKHINYIRVVIAATLMLIASQTTKAEGFIDFSPAKNLISLEVQALAGGSSITQDFEKTISGIKNANVSYGFSGGVGGRVILGFRNYLGIGTGVDLTVNNYRMDVAYNLTGFQQGLPLSSRIDCRYYSASVPIYVTIKFLPLPILKWNVEAGIYYSYGFGGFQNSHNLVATADGNEIITRTMVDKADYFRSAKALARLNHGDMGLHLGTTLGIGSHFFVGAQMHVGFRNVSDAVEGKNPKVHNINLHGLVGYRF